MKKKMTIISFSLLVAAVATYFIFFYPPVDVSKASGAFSKAEKYKEDIVLQGDITLRSDMITDKKKAETLIKDIVQFGDFAVYTRALINEWWLPVLKKYYVSPSILEATNYLIEYSDFIHNNNPIVFKTVYAIAELQSQEKSEISIDVESMIKQFYNYTTQFLIRDSLFETTISSIDKAFDKDIKKQQGIAELKLLRDRIVVDNFFYGMVLGDTSKMNFSGRQPLNDPKTAFGVVVSDKKDSAKVKDLASSDIFNESTLNVIRSAAAKKDGYKPNDLKNNYGIVVRSSQDALNLINTIFIESALASSGDNKLGVVRSSLSFVDPVESNYFIGTADNKYFSIPLGLFVQEVKGQEVLFAKSGQQEGHISSFLNMGSMGMKFDINRGYIVTNQAVFRSTIGSFRVALCSNFNFYGFLSFVNSRTPL